MNAVELGGLVSAGDEGPEVDICGACVRHRGDADLAKEVDAVGGRGDSDGFEIVGVEACQIVVAEVLLGAVLEVHASC